ncbi:sperm flagellar protein 1-like isoform X3 [Monodelphis domestica]|uniref:sperm flagellar protein 1-like isoform X3 n=1 Tax=Monodelphis domestica TaxID=13616 RepID=UPI0024E1FA24|nr:sperm flagellar protein 1-like isoform X3 [Monodelphis domestica]
MLLREGPVQTETERTERARDRRAPGARDRQSVPPQEHFCAGRRGWGPPGRAERSVMIAEIVKHFQPKLVEMHNYIPTSNTEQKLSNWSTLNRQVFPKLRFYVSEEDIRRVVISTPGAIESVLSTLRQKVEEKCQKKAAQESRVNAKDPIGFDSININRHLAELENSKSADCPTSRVPSGKKVSSQKGEDRVSDYSGRQDSGFGQCPHNEPNFQQLLEEKEQALTMLQETVQILQMKVHRLEHLVQLKDMRIEDLTRHLNTPK